MALTSRWRRSRRDRQTTLLVLAGLAASVAAVYVAVVLGGGALIGHTSSPHLGLSVLATAIVALGFEPLRVRLERWASGVVNGGRPSPYDVLSRFSEAVTGTDPHEELPARMAHVLALGTGARLAEVWLVVNGELRRAASWPPHEAPRAEVTPPREGAEPEGRHALGVRLGPELLGVLLVQERDGQPLTPIEQRLFSGLADQAGLVLRGARLRAELAQRVADLSARAEELRLSRERLIDAQDDARQRLERDIHDGAQQHLVALTVNLRLAATLAQRKSPRASAVLQEQVAGVDAATETLLSLSRGIYPRLLSQEGVAAAIRAAAATSAIPIEVHDDGLGRYDASIEAAAYFCCLEALQNAAKHSGASRVLVHLAEASGGLSLSVRDDGQGFDPADADTGNGMANMRDRIDSVGGRIAWVSAPGGGTDVVVAVPLGKLAAAEVVR